MSSSKMYVTWEEGKSLAFYFTGLIERNNTQEIIPEESLLT